MSKQPKNKSRETKKHKDSEQTSFTKSIGLSERLFHNENVNFSLGIILVAFAAVVLLALFSYLTTGAIDQSMLEEPREGEIMNTNGEFLNNCGSLGAHVSYYLIKRCFGLAAFLIPVFIVLIGLRLMRVYKFSVLKLFFGTALVMVWASIALAKFLSPLLVNCHFNPGGDHGLWVCQTVENFVGAPGLVALLALVALVFLVFVSKETIIWIRRILNPNYWKKVKFTVSPAKGDDDTTDEPQETDDDDQPAEVFDNPTTHTVEFGVEGEAKEVVTPTADTPSDKPAKATDAEVGFDVSATKQEEKADSKTVVAEGEEAPYDPKLSLSNYKYPTLDLIGENNDDGTPNIDMAEQTANKDRIVTVLRNFGVEIKTIKATVGPTITLYEITPAEGVRISKIRNLEDDIALSLAALGIRIIAPIPGKGTIGIEVPNAKPNIVSMRSVLDSKKFQETQMQLPLALGKTITNEVFMVDLAKIPHLLVAGATGQGKSVGLNAIITSLLYKKHPAELKFVLIDPKKVEFSIYAPISKYFIAKTSDEDEEPVITDVTKVVHVLKSLCKEMDERYDLLKAAGARNLKEYNQKFVNRKLNPENGHRFMPYIVVIIDEFGDLIMTAGKEIELPIARIAQLARAVGIHMVIATQRPTTTIITGNIKANFPGRMAFKVSSMIDSRTILDRPGANQLIGRGDMLFLNGAEPVRVQCAFIDTPEVERVNHFIEQQPGYLEPLILPEPDTDNGETGTGAGDVIEGQIDPLFEEAARMIVLSQSGSTSMIQRKYSIGYNRAGRLMDQLERAGIVGAASGGKPREVLIHDEVSLDNLIANLRK